jgi:Glycosyltransferase like family
VKFSVIVCSHRPERRISIDAHFQRVFAGREYEFIMIPDAKSLCEGYNRGLAQSTGELIIFSHDDIELVMANSADIIENHLRNFDLIAIAGSTRLIDGNWVTSGDPYTYSTVAAPENESDDGRYRILAYGAGPLVVPNIKAVDGCFFACTRQAAEEVRFDERFDGFHLYDVDFSYRVFRAGYKLAICRDLPLIHFSKGSYDDKYHRYKAMFEEKFAGMLDEGQHSHWRYASIVCHYSQLTRAMSPEGMTRLLAALATAKVT